MRLRRPVEAHQSFVLSFSLVHGSAGALCAAAAGGDGPGLDMNLGQFGGSRDGREGPVRTLIDLVLAFISRCAFLLKIGSEPQLSEIFEKDLFL